MAASSGLEVAHIFRLYGEAYRQEHRLSRSQLRAMRAIELCRTAALGGHVYVCEQCDAQKISYNSCRNRHCPKCQSLDKERWLEQRCRELLPVPYFHVVFTVPHELNPLALANAKSFYNLLFASASETLLEIAADPKRLGARLGVLAVLHTWGQTLELHPHLHCIVPGGGLSLDGQRWVPSPRPNYLLPVQVLTRMFRGKFLAAIQAARQEGRLVLPEPLEDAAAWQALVNRLHAKTWVVYSKPPFAGPGQVLAYLARYTHRVAISNPRLLRLKDDRLTFTYRDYGQRGRSREMTLPVQDFMRRFLLHVLPEGFVRIRYYGLLSSRGRQRHLARCRECLGEGAATEMQISQPTAKEDWQAMLTRLTGRDPTLCPVCGRGHLRLVEELSAVLFGSPSERSPP